MPTFLETQPSDPNYWRGIILLGLNSASYKFALAKSLLELAASGRTFVTMAELAVPYTRHLSEHLKRAHRQTTAEGGGAFIETCRGFSEGRQTQDQAIEAAVRIGFNDVIRAFHVVNRGPIPTRFFVDDRQSKKGITLTDTMHTLAADDQAVNLPVEVEARWRLVETAWELRLPPSLLTVQYDQELEAIFVQQEDGRINVTGCREALNGFQKGRCFYCLRKILINADSGVGVDIDHFFPLTLRQYSEFAQLNLNGIWNLVLACEDCNRGAGGKFTRVPQTPYLERLHNRNQFLIESHLPLKETLINQLGSDEDRRRTFLQCLHSDATVRLLHQWKPKHEFPEST